MNTIRALSVTLALASFSSLAAATVTEPVPAPAPAPGPAAPVAPSVPPPAAPAPAAPSPTEGSPTPPRPGYPGSAHPPQSELSPREPLAESSYRLALGTQGAKGLTHQSFYNQLVTARIDRRFGKRFALGAALSYANLRGKDGRAHNILPGVQFEYRPELGKGWYLPVRYVLGYLPKNGPYTQVSLGIGTDLSDTVELNFDLLAPTIWLTDDLPVTSLNFGVELAYRL